MPPCPCLHTEAAQAWWTIRLHVQWKDQSQVFTADGRPRFLFPDKFSSTVSANVLRFESMVPNTLSTPDELNCADSKVFITFTQECLQLEVPRRLKKKTNAWITEPAVRNNPTESFSKLSFKHLLNCKLTIQQWSAKKHRKRMHDVVGPC